MPQINIRWSDNTADLKARLKEGIGVIDAMKASVDKTAAALGGQGLFKAANNLTAAIVQLGGATKLTASEQDRANALLTKAIEKYTLMGQVAPAAMRQIQAETSKTANGLAFMEQHTVGATDFMKKYAVAAEPAAVATSKLGNFAGLASSALGSLGIGLSVGAAVGFAKSIAEDADALVKMHDKTGISLQGLQKFQIAADDAGNTIDQLTLATNQMQNRLAGGDKSALAAIEKLGLSLDHLKTLSPDQQFMEIATAIRGIQDPAEQVNAAMAIFGRSGAEILPTIKRGFDDLKDAVVGMSDETVKGLDRAGDAWKKFVRETKGAVGEFLADISPGLENAVKILEFLRGQKGLKDFEVPNAPTPAGSPNFGKAPALFPNPVPPNLATAEMFLGRMEASQKKVTTATSAWAQAMAELNAVGTDFQATLDTMNGDTVEAIKFYLAAGVSQSALATAYGLTAVQVRAVDESMKAVVKDIPLLTGALAGVPDALAPLSAFHKGLIDFDTTLKSQSLGGGLTSIVPGQFATSMTKELRPGLTAGFSDLFKTSIPAAITSAFQGGGSPVKAVGSLLGSQLGTNLVTKVGTTITGSLGKIIGGGINAILPGLGSLIGPGLNALVGGIKKLFGGPSAEEVAGRKTSADFQATLANMLTAQQKLEAGGVGWKMSVIAVRDAYLATGRTAAEAEAATAKLFDTKNPNAYKAAIEEINGVLDEQKQDAADLQTAIQKYGFSLDQLGPVLQKQKLDEQAKTLINDWRLLVGAGIDIKTVNDKMASSVNDYLQTAKRTGTEIPAAFKPVLQSMIDQGTLIDENGNKITDLGEAGLTFSETMTQGFDRVVAALNRVLVGLGLVPEALAAIPDNKTIDVNVNYNDAGFTPGIQPDQSGGGVDTNTGLAASMGGRVTRFGLQHLAGGGIVQGLRMPQFLGVGGWAGMQTLFQPRGTDTVPAMLTPGETVRTVPQEQALTNALSGNSSAILAELKAINDNLARTRQTIVQIENKEIARATIRAWNDGTDGLLTQAKEALGVD